MRSGYRLRLLGVSISVAVALQLGAPLISSGAWFVGLGDLPGGGFDSVATGISADGTTVVGESSGEAFRWTRSTGMVGLGSLPHPSVSGSSATGVSADGSVVVGNSLGQGFRWTSSTGMVGLESLGLAVGSEVLDVSADGSVVVGTTGGDAFRWSETDGMTLLTNADIIPGHSVKGWAHAVSNSGDDIAGSLFDPNPPVPDGFRWTANTGTQVLDHGFLGISGNGTVLVGGGGWPAFRWTEATGFISLPGPTPSVAWDASFDGSVIVGEVNSYAALWGSDDALRNIQELLEAQGLDLTGWHLRSAWGVSDDGLVVTGYGTNPDGDQEAWIANLAVPEPGSLALVGSVLVGFVVLRRRRGYAGHLTRVSIAGGLAIALTAALPAQAALHDRGGGLIYDDVLDATWLQDANYAAIELSAVRADQIIAAVGTVAGHALTVWDFKPTGVYNGIMTWWGAMAWADQLSYYDSVRNVTHEHWQLPTVRPVDGIAFDYEHSDDGSTDHSFNLSAPGSAYPGSTASPMAYMYYNNLGTLAEYDTSGNAPQPGWTGTPNASFTDGTTGLTVSFENLQAAHYWSGTEHVPDETVWTFIFQNGYQHADLPRDGFYAWAVRDGDVAVPEPNAMVLVGSVLVGLVALCRR